MTSDYSIAFTSNRCMAKVTESVDDEVGEVLYKHGKPKIQ